MNAYKQQESINGAGGWHPEPGPARQKAPAPKPAGRLAALNRALHTSRRTRLIAAANLVIVCALAVPILVTLLTPKPAQALSAVHELPAGTVLTPADLRPVTASGPAGAMLPAGEESGLVGQQIRQDVPAGALLNSADLGPFPPIGASVVPVAVKPGQYPANLEAGQGVAVFPIASGATATQAAPAAHAAASGTVVQITSAAGDGTGAVVVDLELPTGQAPAVAQAPAVVLVGLDARSDAP